MKNFLEKQFQFSHDYCIYLHDILAHFIVFGEKKRIFNVQLTLSNENEAKSFERASDIDIWDWLEKYGYSEILGEILIKSLFPALLSDLCHFVYESLSCSRKAKLTVAYALLRKPLKENLHYLEWLLSDPEEFLNTFYNKESIELSFNRIGNPDRIKNVIKNAKDRIPNKLAFDAEFLYDLRFNKACPYGFDGSWNKATHLVTTKDPIATEKQNFNFIFSNDESRLSQWSHLYGRLPYILFYAVEICEMLMAFIMKKLMPDYAESSFHRSLGFIIWGIETQKFDNKQSQVRRASEGLSELVLDCPQCNQKIEPDENLIRTLYETLKMKCPNCNKRLKLQDFINKKNT